MFTKLTICMFVSVETFQNCFFRLYMRFFSGRDGGATNQASTLRLLPIVDAGSPAQLAICTVCRAAHGANSLYVLGVPFFVTTAELPTQSELLTEVDILLITSFELAIVVQVGEREEQDDAENGAARNGTGGSNSEQSGYSDKEHGDDEEQREEIGDWKETPDHGSTSQTSCRPNWDLSKGRKWIPNDGTNQVDEQVRQRDLERRLSDRTKSRDHGLGGGTEVGTDDEGVDGIKPECANASERDND